MAVQEAVMAEEILLVLQGRPICPLGVTLSVKCWSRRCSTTLITVQRRRQQIHLPAVMIPVWVYQSLLGVILWLMSLQGPSMATLYAGH